jgi:SAM-dependent methyltransferase
VRAINVRVPAAKRVLDFGCGTGWVLAEAEMEIEQTVRVGIDLSLEDLQHARRRFGLNFAVSDGLCLPFADETFDVVVGHVSMPYMNTAKALAEIYRVMTPGASLLLTFHTFRYFRERIWNSWKSRNAKDVAFSVYMAANGLLNHWSIPQMRCCWKPDRFETVNTPRGVSRSARSKGFVLASVEHDSGRIFFAFTARKPNAPAEIVLPAPGWSIYSRLARTEERLATWSETGQRA